MGRVDMEQPTDRPPARDVIPKPVTVPRDDAEWFDSHYPMHGAWSWFVREALAQFRRLNEVNPNELIELGVKELSKTSTGVGNASEES
jgi:hypothetical protein